MALADELVAYYGLEEASGATRADSHTAGPFHLEENNAVVPVEQVAGVVSGFGAAANFTTDMGLLTSPASGTALNMTGDVTISAWFRPDDASGIKEVCNIWDGNINDRKFLLRYNAGGGPDMTFFVSSTGADVQSVAMTRTLSAGTWYHVVARFNDAGDWIDLTVDDGSRVSAARTQSGLFQTDSTMFRVFQFVEGGTNNTDDNSLDEIGVWARALSDEEVTQLYNAGTPLMYDDIITAGNGGGGGAGGGAAGGTPGGGGGNYVIGPGLLWR